MIFFPVLFLICWFTFLFADICLLLDYYSPTFGDSYNFNSFLTVYFYFTFTYYFSGLLNALLYGYIIRNVVEKKKFSHDLNNTSSTLSKRELIVSLEKDIYND